MRYLTSEEKTAHLEDWARCRAEYARDIERARADAAFYAERFGGYQVGDYGRGRVDLDHPDPLPGSGFPDTAIYELTDRLNAVEGVVTVQSCAGHRVTEDHRWGGQLWIRVSEPVMRHFLRRVQELTDCKPTIERVQVIFDRQDDGDVIDIIFEGMNAGKDALDRAGAIIADFFEAMAMAVQFESAVSNHHVTWAPV